MSKSSLHTESDLLGRIADGDEAAFRVLFHDYWPNIYGVAFMLTKSEALAEDLVQDVFVQVWLKRAELPKIGQFGDWLFIVARNRVLNELRKRSREAPFTESLLEYFQDQRRTPEQIFLQREAGRLIHESIERLAPQQQAVYRMSREQGMSHEAIADALGISKNTVHNHLTQALRNMRAYLESHSDGLLLWISVITAWLS